MALSIAITNGPRGNVRSTVPPTSAKQPALRTANPRTAKLPLRFEANAGQWDLRVRFVAKLGAATLFITDDGATIGLRNGERTKAAAVSLKLVGVNTRTPLGEKELVTKSNFFLGSDPKKWRTNVANYAQVRTKGSIPGVDVVWHGGDDGLEYDLAVGAGVDARELAFEIAGADGVSVAENGSLEMATAAGVLVQKPPRVLQDGRELRTRYVTRATNRVAFAVEGYDGSRPLLIDPVLTYSTYLGGSTGSEACEDIAVDASGNAYVTGYTDATDFPTAGAYQPTYGGGSHDVIITKLSANGNALVYSTYLGGSGEEGGYAIAVDGTGNVYAAGRTYSTNFPLASAHQSTLGGGADGFVTKLNASGSALVYSTYLGGSGDEYPQDVAIDTSGNAYLTGYTTSTNFPTASPYQSANGGGSFDVFVTKLNATGSTLTYSTYLGGSGGDSGAGIAIDSTGSAYVTGAAGPNFPLMNAYQSTNGGGYDAFVTKLSAAGTALTYSTYIGGNGLDEATGIAVDATDNVYITGDTASTNFPMASAYQGTFAGGANDSFVTKLNATGSALVYSTYLGGSGYEYAQAISIDGGGNAFVVGYTASTNFPTARPYQSSFGGAVDAFVTRLNATGSALTYSTYFGGSNNDDGYAIAVDSAGSAYIAGSTLSTDLPTLSAYDTTLSGVDDVFVAKIADPELALGTSCAMAGDCASGQCVDGVCCDTACNTQCAACDVSGHTGTCTPVSGAPHGSRVACATIGPCAAVCDGTNVNACTYPPTVCASSCANATETESLCDNTGACVAQTPQPCNNFVCADTSKCKTICATNADCANSLNCMNDGTCGTGASCVDDHTSKGADGVAKECAPYQCDRLGTGSCKTSCNSIDDCLSPNICDGTGECAAAPSSDGGCNLAPERPPWWLLGLSMIGVLAVRQRARKRR